MNCRNFQSNLIEWIGERLPEPGSEAMRAHAEVCTPCAHEAANERSLRAVCRAVGDSARTPDLWPALAARLEQQQSRRVFAWPRISFAPRWAGTGALAAGAFCALLFWNQGRTPTTDVNIGPADVRVERPGPPNVVHLVAAMQEVADPDSEIAADSPKASHTPWQQRAVLVGDR